MMALFLLASVVKIVSAQSTPNFKKLTRDDGLSQTTVNCILQDKQGFMWFGTEDGLNKYDGYQFTVYRSDEFDSLSISHNYIRSISQDSSGKIWVGTIGGGLNRFDPENESFTHFKHDPDNTNSLSDNDVYSLYSDKSGMLWIGTIGGGLNRFDPENESFTHFKHDPDNTISLSDNDVYALYEDTSGRIWIGTQNGLDIFEPDTKRFKHFQYNSRTSNGISSNNIRSIFEDRKGNVWIGTFGGGLNLFDRNRGTFTTFRNDPGNAFSLSNDIVYSINEDHSGTLWIGTSGGLNRFNNTNQSFDRYQHKIDDSGSLSNNSVHSIYKDMSGILWIGTLNQINLLSSFKKGFINYPNEVNNTPGISEGFVSAIYQRRSGEIWVGLVDGGLYKYNIENQILTHFEHDPNDSGSLTNDIVTSIYEDASKSLWIGTFGGIDLYNSKFQNFNHFKNNPNDPGSLSNNRVFSILRDHFGALWVGTIDGLNRFDPDDGTFVHYFHEPDNLTSLSNSDIRAIYEDQSGELWFINQGGINKYVRESDSFIIYQHDPDNPLSISDNHVKSMYQDASQQYWVGTHKGLNRFDPVSGNFKAYRVKDGLPNDVVYNILEDDMGHLWLSTNHGISKFSPEEESFKNYDTGDGLKGNEFVGGAYCKLKSGYMTFGGLNGLTLFHPDSIKENPFIPPVVFTQFTRYNTKVSETRPIVEKGISHKKELTLSYRENILMFEFASLNYNMSSKNEYSYQLKGFSDNWIDLGTEHKVTFTNLDPGDYTLGVKGSNNDGVWNPSPTSLKLIVLPPWWQTTWAYLIYGVTFFASLYTIRRFELKRKMSQLETKRLQEIDLLKSQLYTNITHEFRTPLTVINGMADQIREWVHRRAYGKIEEATNLIHRNSNNLLNLINQILDLGKFETGNLRLKLVQGDVVPYLQFLTESFQYYADSKNIKLVFYREVDELIMDYDPDKLLIIVSNLLTNALKFTNENGKVIFHVNEIRNNQTHSLVMKVKDSGIGIDELSLEHIFDRYYQVNGSLTRQTTQGTGIGLALTKEVVQLMGGSIIVKSKPKEGTEFSINLPATLGEGIPSYVREEWDILKEKSSVFIPIAKDITTVNSQSLTISDKPLLLIVEDSPDILIYLKTCLEHNYQIVVAMDGEEGIAMATELIPDIIISDIMMPKKDGLELCDTLKQQAVTSHIPIILLTAKVTFKDKLTGLEHGADAYLEKPFNKKELLIRIRKLIEHRDRLQQHFASFDKPFSGKEKSHLVENAFLQKIHNVVEANLDVQGFGTSRLYREMGMSRTHVYRKLMALTGKSTSHVIRSIRLNKAKDLLNIGDLTVAEVAYKVGFKDPSYFSRGYVEEFGISPNVTRKQL